MTTEQTNTRILLLSDSLAVVEKIRLRLEESIRSPCSVWHCHELVMALESLNAGKHRTDIIILDLGLIGTISPKEIYEKMGEAAQNIPIIALTGTSEEQHELATFVMEAGASDHMVRGRFNRLTDAIEFSLIRNKIAMNASDKNASDVETTQTGHNIAMIKAKRKSDKNDHQKNQYISWIMGGYSVEEN